MNTSFLNYLKAGVTLANSKLKKMRMDSVERDNQVRMSCILVRSNTRPTGVGVIKIVYTEKNTTLHLNKLCSLLSISSLSPDV